MEYFVFRFFFYCWLDKIWLVFCSQVLIFVTSVWLKSRVYLCAVCYVTDATVKSTGKTILHGKINETRSSRCTAKEMSNKICHNRRSPPLALISCSALEWYFISGLTRLFPHKKQQTIFILSELSGDAIFCYTQCGSSLCQQAREHGGKNITGTRNYNKPC